MKAVINVAWFIAGSAGIVVGLGVIAKVYWLLFNLGWRLL